ncbi:MAG: right-handed parallel beta-helix repeat-containing protein [Candidatus Hodarchaeales archaeon]|jgi:parallel beta-helix repeat protein
MRSSQILVAILFASLVIEPTVLSKFSSDNGKLAIPRLIEDVTQNPEIKDAFPVVYLSNEKIENSLNASITGRYWDYGNDTDNDGKFNTLVIIAEINVTIKGVYTITIELYPSVSSFSWKEENTNFLNPGIQNVSLPFYIAEVYSEQLIASYKVNQTQITVNNNSLILDEEYSNYTSQIYQYTDFNPPKVYLTGSYWVIDTTDFFGFIDRFYFAASFQFTVGGYYRINVTYYTTEGNKSSWLSVNRGFGVGNLNIEFYLDTLALYNQNLNTSYCFTSITILDEDFVNVGTVFLNQTTRRYLYTEFTPPVIIPSGMYLDYGVDTDSNGKFNFLAIVIELNLTRAYNIYFNIYIELIFGNIRRSTNEIFWLADDGPVILYIDTATFYSYFTFSGEESDSFLISFLQISYSPNEIIYEEVNPYITTEYFFYEFDSPLIAIEGSESFDYYAKLEGWKGTGTLEDPYIIEGLILNGTTYSFPIIEIRNTQDHFVIQKCVLIGADFGIKLVDVKNAYIANNTFLEPGVGIELQNCMDININQNMLISKEKTGIIAEQTENISIKNNEIKNAERGIIFYLARGISLSNNVLSSNNGWVGIKLEELNYSNITENQVHGFNYAGILLDACTSIKIQKNLVFENFDALIIGGHLPQPPYSSRWNNVSENLICENYGYGIKLDYLAKYNSFQRNIISNMYQNGSFLVLDPGENNTFRNNYWQGFTDIQIEGGNNEDLNPLSHPYHLTPPTLIHPIGGETFSGEIVIQWFPANDMFNQDLNYSIYYSPDNGTSWEFLNLKYTPLITIGGMVGFKNQWIINHSIIIPGSNYLIRIIVSDPFGFSVMDTSDSPFTIELQEKSTPVFSPNMVGFMLFAACILLWGFLRIKKTGQHR